LAQKEIQAGLLEIIFEVWLEVAVGGVEGLGKEWEKWTLLLFCQMGRSALGAGVNQTYTVAQISPKFYYFFLIVPGQIDLLLHHVRMWILITTSNTNKNFNLLDED
jgi:hypothetical protein